MTTESTASELRKTGISVIGDVRWGTHFCCFYETKQDLLDTLVLFFKAGLDHNEFCLWVVSQPLTVEEAKRALKQTVSDLDRRFAEGSLEIHGYDEWYLQNGQCDPQRVLQGWCEKLNQALARGHAGMRASGDTAWIQKDHWSIFCEYEKELDALIADRRRIILCTYTLATSPGNQIFDVVRTHQVAVARRHGNWEVLETPELKEAKAEIKRLNEELELKVEERTKELAAANEALRSEIAERKLAEEAVKQAEDRIRLVIDTIPTMAWSLRPDGAVDFVNQRWMEYTGLSLEEALEDSKRIVHPEDLPRAVEKWLPDMVAGNPHEDEMRLRRADGEYRWFLIRIAPLLDEQGNLVKWYGASIEIEDRKQAEMHSRMLIDAIPQQIWSGPPDGTIDYCNDRWRSYMGIALENLQGDGWQTMLHPDDRDRVLKAWHESVVKGTPYEQEERHRGADGTYRWFLARGVPLNDTEGRIVRWYGTNTDIEDRKRAEDRLRRSEEKFKALFGIAPVGISVLDGQHNVIDANPALEQITRLSKEELLNGSWRHRAYLNADGTPKPLKELPSKHAVTENRPINNVETGIVTENGEIIWTQVSVAPLALPDASAVVITLDITKRKQAEQALRESEERFRELAENIDEVFWLIDVKRTAILYVSPAYEKLWGRSCDSLYASPRSWIEAIHPEDQERIVQILADHELQTAPDMVYRIIRPDGSTRWVQARGFPVHDGNGAVVRIAGIAEDITERKRAAKELEGANHQLRALSARLQSVREEEATRIAREIHDELGQKLTGLKMDLLWMERKLGKLDGPPALNALLERVVGATELTDEIIVAVQEIAAQLRPGVLDKLGLGTALQYEARRFHERAGIPCAVHLPEIEPALSLEVSTALFRIFQECLTNIARHAHATKTEAALKLEDAWAILRVQDNGRGLTPTAITSSGSLGLLGMKERAALLGGEILFERGPEGGTLVTVRIAQTGVIAPGQELYESTHR